jgi:hypothetical protein
VETVAIWLVIGAVVLVFAFWLIVLPFRLTRGLIHKWGLHTYCGHACPEFQTAAAIRLQKDESYKKGMRQGIRSVFSFGEAESKKFLDDLSLMPKWTLEPNADEFRERVWLRYDKISFAMDTSDDPQEWVAALSLSLGIMLRQYFKDPEAALEAQMPIIKTAITDGVDAV